MRLLAEAANGIEAQIAEFLVRDGEYDCVVRSLGRLSYGFDAVLVVSLSSVNPWIVDVYLCTVLLQLANDVSNFRIAQVRAVFLEGEPHDEDSRPLHVDTLANHQLGDTLGNVDRHVVVDATTRQDHLRVVTDLLRLVRQIVRVDTDAMTADEAG